MRNTHHQLHPHHHKLITSFNESLLTLDVRICVCVCRCAVMTEFTRETLAQRAVRVIVPGEKDRVVVSMTEEEKNGKEGERAEEKRGERDGETLQDERKGVEFKTAAVGERCEAGLRVLEGLAASGLRSIRFALEVPGLKRVTANDFSAKAADLITRNARYNSVTHLIETQNRDAR